MKIVGYILNTPWTLVGLILAAISGPRRIRIVPGAIVFDVRSFWWTHLLPHMRKNRIRGITNGNVISLGPLVEERDLAHELVHVKQFMRSPFITPLLYLVEVWKHGTSPKNKYEYEAYATTGSVYRGDVLKND